MSYSKSSNTEREDLLKNQQYREFSEAVRFASERERERGNVYTISDDKWSVCNASSYA